MFIIAGIPNWKSRGTNMFDKLNTYIYKLDRKHLKYSSGRNFLLN